MNEIFQFTPSEEMMDTYPHLRFAERRWMSDEYLIALHQVGKFSHIKVRRWDNAPINDFYVLQWVKNIVLGTDAMAVQIYPKEAEMVDGSNTYHLWAWEGMENVCPNLGHIPRYH